MLKKISINQNVTTILIIFLFSFGFFVNFFYGSLGVFPIDTFLHYDSGYRILNGEYPVKDFWIVSGLFVDFFAALLFKIFGVNWYTHIAHSSLLNGLITILTFYFLTKMNLDAKFAFFYSVFFSILAYPPSGTPFVDHHATFLSLAGLYFFILGVKYQTNLYWYVFPWFLGSAFLCKQVPVTYLMILIIPIFLSFCIIRKNFNPIFKSIISSIIFCLIFLLFLTLTNIDLNLFLKQYIFYPRSFGSARYDDFYLNLNTFFNNYKFILVVYLGIVIVNYKLFLKDKKFFKSGSFFYFLIISSLVFSLIFHQVFTKNQIYIYFLIPLLCGVFHSCIINSKFKFQKNLIIILIIIFTLLISGKYHFRYNETRKFQDLKNINFKLGIDAGKIHASLKGLNWITQDFSTNPTKEINIIKDVIEKLREDKSNKILITHYLFFSAITEQNLFSPSKTYTLDGASFPVKGGIFYNEYKEFLNSIITRNNIEKIYFIKNEKIEEKVIKNYINSNCYDIYEEKYFKYFLIKKECFN